MILCIVEVKTFVTNYNKSNHFYFYYNFIVCTANFIFEVRFK